MTRHITHDTPRLSSGCTHTGPHSTPLARGAPLLLLLAACVVLLLPGWAHAQNLSDGTGLEVSNHKHVFVGIGYLSNAMVKIGLTHNRVRTRAELRLRQAGLHPERIEEKLYIQESEGYMQVSIHVEGDGICITLDFKRLVRYFTSPDQQRRMVGTTWQTGATGTSSGNPEFIIQKLDSVLDIFLNAYLKANSP